MQPYQIRGTFDAQTITVYQAYNQQIAAKAVEHQTFVAPFSFQRMTWIKPSFLWMMERSNWGLKKQQEHILAIQIKRTAWESILKKAVLTSPEKRIYKDSTDWRIQFDKAPIYIQWDPERSIRGKKLEYRSIQLGISRDLIKDYTEKWIVSIQDITPLVRKMHNLCKKGHYTKAKTFLPKERIYPLSDEIKGIIGAL